MAHTTGPVKGTIAIVCEDPANFTAETHTFILEPIHASAANFAAMEGGTCELTTSALLNDESTVTKYFDASVTTSGLGANSPNRQTGPVKGLVVVTDWEPAGDNNAISASYIVEPIHVDKPTLDGILAGNYYFILDMQTDSLGMKYFTGAAYSF